MVLYYVELMKNSKSLNNASSKGHLCVVFVDANRSVIAYTRMFDECCPVPLLEERLYIVHKDTYLKTLLLC